jgi:hypothetical protein
MARKLMSWISLGTLVAGLVTIAMGIAALIGVVVQGSAGVVPALLQMSAGIACWTAGVHLARSAHAVAPATPPIALPTAVVTNLAEARRSKARLGRLEAIPVPLAA